MTAATINRPRRSYAWLLLVPAGIWYLVFFLIPSFFPLVFSFAQSDPTGGVILKDFSLANYARFLDCNFLAWNEFGECIYLKVFTQTIVFALFGTLGCLLLAYPLAYFLATRVGKWRITLLVLIIIPFWTSFLIRTYAWVVLLADQGLINSFLVNLGLIADDARIPMLYNPFAVYLGIVYNYLPLMIFPLYVSLERLDKSLLEASKDLGADRLATFRQVTLPLTAPGLFTGILLTFIPLTGEYIVPAILGGSKTLLMGNLVANQFLQSRDWSFGSASSVMLILILVAFILIWYRASEGQEVEVV